MRYHVLMNNRRNLIIAIVVVLLVAAVAIAYLVRGERPGSPGAGPGGTGGGANSSTSAPVPSDVTVPELGDSDLPENVARPSAVTEAAPGVSADFRAFAVSVENGKFVPDTVIVRQGDTANIRFTAADRDYDFRQPDYGLASPLRKGVAQTIEFAGVTTGKYTFFCESCGGPASGPVGYIIVVPNDD